MHKSVSLTLGSARFGTFDVFDTLLTRRLGSPESIFREVGRRAQAIKLIKLSPEAFSILRQKAELNGRLGSEDGEVTLSRIYEILGAWTSLGREQVQRVQNIELELEMALIEPTPEGSRLVQHARDKNMQIGFISDMYLPSAIIVSMLSRHGLYRPDDLIMVSAETGASKSRGQLYAKLFKKTGLNGAQFEHTGDNPHSDVQMAKSFGIQARWLPGACLNRYERILEEAASETHDWSSVFAGSSRLTRLEGQDDEVLRRIVSGVVAPVLTAFVLWLLRTAISQRISQLIFVSRDGFLLKAIADQIIEHFGIDCSTVYLFGSRQAFHLPAVKEITETELKWMLNHTSHTTPGMIARRCGLGQDHMGIVLGILGRTKGQENVPCADQDIRLLREALTRPGRLQDCILTEAASQRQAACSYFDSLRLGQTGKAGFVDLGWNGSLELSFHKLLSPEASDRISGFYFGLRPNLPPEVEHKASAFLFGHKLPPEPLEFIIPMMESFCTAEHPPVTGFRQVVSTGAVEPIFEPGHDAALRAWGGDAVHVLTRRFVQVFLETADLLGRSPFQEGEELVFQPVVRRLLSEFIENPSREEAARWGAFPYDTEQSGGRYYPMAQAPRVCPSTLWRALWIGDVTALDNCRGPIVWTQAIAKQTPLILRTLVKGGKMKRKFGMLLRNSAKPYQGTR